MNQSVRSSIESAETGGGKPAVLCIKFYYTRRMADILKEEAEKERLLAEERESKRLADEEARRKKYAIVERIKEEMRIKEGTKNLSLVDKYALEAQAEFQMVSMKELRDSGNFSCPRKYLNQRD